MTAALTMGGAFALGLIASGHCVLMCGGIAGALGTMTQRDARGRAHPGLLVGYQIGRVASYTLAGLTLGGAGGALIHFVDQESVRIALRWATALVFAGLGLSLLRGGHGVGSAIGRKVWARLAPYARRLLPVQHLHQAIALGAVWGWMPCGLVYSALFMAWLSMDALSSAGIMLMFGLGTTPAVLASAFGATKALARLSFGGVRSSLGAMLLALGALTAVGPWLAAYGMPVAAMRWLPFDCATP